VKRGGYGFAETTTYHYLFDPNPSAERGAKEALDKGYVIDDKGTAFSIPDFRREWRNLMRKLGKTPPPKKRTGAPRKKAITYRGVWKEAEKGNFVFPFESHEPINKDLAGYASYYKDLSSNYDVPTGLLARGSGIYSYTEEWWYGTKKERKGKTKSEQVAMLRKYWKDKSGTYA
jgi:hypothetical protein